MKVYLTKMCGSCYEDKWESDTGIFSTMEKALEEFEDSKRMYEIGTKQLEERYLDKEWTNEMEFANSYFEWNWFEICEYEVDDGCKEQHVWELKKGEWHELNN